MAIEHNEWMEMVRTIALFIHEQGYPPTRRELMKRLGITSLAVINHRINRLVEMGYITHQPGKARTIVITRDGKEAMKLHKKTVDDAAAMWQESQSRGIL